MYSPRSQAGECGADGRKYAQWMREAMESRVKMEELKAQNDKLQREIYGLNSKLNLVYECCTDMGLVDRLGDLMQRKVHEFQAAQSDDEGFICGSSAFQDVAAYSSSYKGQISRGNFHRVRVFEAEEAKLRDQFDIFGVAKLPLHADNRTGDTIDKLLISEAANSPRQSARQPAIPGPNQGRL
ncbi:uncharacterized protein PITG_02209 [Phytophthora infestans T30-4]|uniref:Uncharacterized protein n=1 Tax=Phytophthora infestans (strain T30-4) TaxID=403677 RepID=D0MVR7_PHYIT|nr:uncharacterized protein PITG_02209 [Phytophthora infestans T30-4]EEY63730.1 hypothetical protein PITG_02209 [Phytophthora infestans T30-4]|eukprot:XP_002907166.1 hypothetical protein PITG_02209 [Phytophthora infestans T30-4]